MTMTKREYAEEIAKAIYGEVLEQTKNNGVVRMAVRTSKGSIAPVMYVDDAYENGEPIKDMVDRYNEALAQVKEQAEDFEWMHEWDKVKSNLKVKLINKAKNPGTEVYRSAKTYGFSDLIIVPYIDDVNVNGHKGRVMVTQDMVNNWGVTKRTVIDNGIRNIEIIVMSLAEKLAEVMPLGMAEELESPFYIVSTAGDGQYGAVGIIKAKERLQAMFPNGYYIIPSSIHEMLVLPMEFEADPENLKGIIGEVNESVLDAVDYLSDHPYIFEAVA